LSSFSHFSHKYLLKNPSALIATHKPERVKISHDFLMAKAHYPINLLCVVNNSIYNSICVSFDKVHYCAKANYGFQQIFCVKPTNIFLLKKVFSFSILLTRRIMKRWMAANCVEFTQQWMEDFVFGILKVNSIIFWSLCWKIVCINDKFIHLIIIVSQMNERFKKSA
jgi:hypothetical protein